MEAANVVLLLVVAIVSQSNAQLSNFLGGGGGGGGQLGGQFGGGFPGGFPGGLPGGFPGGFPGGLPGGFPGGFPRPGLPGFPGQGPPGFPNIGGILEPQILTCIGRNEALDQVRITMRPEPGTSSFLNPLNNNRHPSLRKQNWRISAIYIPAASAGQISPPNSASLVGQFFMAITRYGRTDGHCAGLGGILQNEDLMEPNNGGLGSNPFLGGLFGGGNSFFGGSQGPPGHIQDPIVISQGGNVYSGVIRDLSEADLRGRGIGICLDALCQRPTTTCCSIVKDNTPASEQVGHPTYQGPVAGSLLQSGGALGGNLGGTLGGLTGNLGGTGGGLVIDGNVGNTGGGGIGLFA